MNRYDPPRVLESFDGDEIMGLAHGDGVVGNGSIVYVISIAG